MPIKAILFDKDGTLVDFHATYDAATAQVLEQICSGSKSLLEEAAEVLDFDLETRKIRHGSIIVAGSGFDITSRLQPVLKIEDVEAYSRYLDKLYGEICVGTVKWLPGSHQALKRLNEEGSLLGIATNDSEANAKAQMAALGADRLFLSILGADSGYGGKPGPGMVQAFSAETGIYSHEILMVGDSTHDLQAGKAAQTVTCAVETGPADRADLEREADHIIKSIADLPELLGKLV